MKLRLMPQGTTLPSCSNRERSRECAQFHANLERAREARHALVEWATSLGDVRGLSRRVSDSADSASAGRQTRRDKPHRRVWHARECD
jgi:hypothetical protein